MKHAEAIKAQFLANMAEEEQKELLLQNSSQVKSFCTSMFGCGVARQAKPDST
jgi:hypothetical protein